MKNNDITKSYRTRVVIAMIISALVVCLALSLLIFNFGGLKRFLTGTDMVDSSFSANEVLLFVILGVLLFALIFYLLQRRSIGYIKNIADAVEKISAGDLETKIEVRGDDEFSGMAESINRMAVDLKELLKLERESEQQKTELITNIAHDLRTPLTLIRGYGEVMRDIPGEMNAENMQIIIDETTRLSSLVSDMLDISRLMSGKMTLEKSVFSITDAVRETVERYSKLREKEGFEIEFETDADISVKADKSKILQVIYNLVNNAINYTGEDKKVTIRQSVKDGKCRVEVIDSGCGIPEEDLPLIWERYYKASEFHRRSEMGTGLGLSIVKNILVMHGAAFGVRSLVGHGSTFWFELPVE